jgi:sugar lactone lactonase YvrE
LIHREPNYQREEYEMKPTIDKKQVLRILLILLTITALAAGSPAVAADGTRVFTLDPSTHGNPEGVAFDPSSGAFFVGSTGDGTIYRGTLDNPTVTEFIPGAQGKEAVGMKVANGKLYVACGFSGAVRVYNIVSRQLVASFETGGGGMLNDLVVTRTGDVFVTDSFRPTLWRITAAQVAAGGGTPAGIPVEPEIQYVVDPFPFNLNGIVALKGGQQLVVGQSNTGKLFRIDLDNRALNGRKIHEIAVEPLFSDGLLLDKGQLIVVTFDPALTFVKLDDNAEQGKVIERRTDPTLREPSTVARARNFYLVVNADFTTSATPFTVTGLARNDDDDD